MPTMNTFNWFYFILVKQITILNLNLDPSATMTIYELLKQGSAQQVSVRCSAVIG